MDWILFMAGTAGLFLIHTTTSAFWVHFSDQRGCLVFAEDSPSMCGLFLNSVLILSKRIEMASPAGTWISGLSLQLDTSEDVGISL